jgi:hypothetical protein
VTLYDDVCPVFDGCRIDVSWHGAGSGSVGWSPVGAVETKLRESMSS